MKKTEEKQQNGKKKKKHNILFIIFFIIFVSALCGLVFYFYRNKQDKKVVEALRDIKNEPITIGESEEDKSLGYYLINGTVVQEEFKDLYMKNQDIIGWIKINDTPIDYPVMCTPKDEQYYIHTNFDKEYSFSGSIFASAETDIKTPSDNIITYGHHMNDSSMYHDIDKYEDEEYYKQHKYITFDTLRQTGTYEVIAAFRTKVVYYKEDGFMYYEYCNMGKSDFEEYVSKSKELTPYKIDTTAEYGDQLVTLSTCAYHTYNGRFVVVAKRIDGLEVDLEQKPIEIIDINED